MVKLILVCALFFVAQIGWTQNELEYRNRIGLSYFKLEKNVETINNKVEPKFVPGIYYEKIIGRKSSWFNSFEYGENTIKDYCTCADAPMGDGRLDELNITTGIKYFFNWRSQSKFKFFVELDAYYSRTRYSGSFSGGWSQLIFDNTYLILGGSGRIGINYYVHPRFVITASTSMRIGKTWKENNIAKWTAQTSSGAISLLELRIGFLF